MTKEEKKLKAFLISKGAFDAYMKNIQSVECCGVCAGGDEGNIEIKPIPSAFFWSVTPEDNYYWYRLHEEYKNTK